MTFYNIYIKRMDVKHESFGNIQLYSNNDLSQLQSTLTLAIIVYIGRQKKVIKSTVIISRNECSTYFCLRYLHKVVRVSLALHEITLRH